MAITLRQPTINITLPLGGSAVPLNECEEMWLKLDALPLYYGAFFFSFRCKVRLGISKRLAASEMLPPASVSTR
jgi:hypothetical protein